MSMMLLSVSKNGVAKGEHNTEYKAGYTLAIRFKSENPYGRYDDFYEVNRDMESLHGFMEGAKKVFNI